MRVYISADIEGVAGIAHRFNTGPAQFDFASGRKWMTQEVLAAAEAAREAGASEVIVADGHGTGNNLLLDDLPDYVRVVRSWPRPLLQMQGIELGPFAAAVLIGHHASAQATGGVLAHTYTLTYRDIRVNGVSQSETSLNGLVAAHYGVPVVFSSGDEDYIAHCREVFPGIETVTTKSVYGMSSVVTITPAVAQRQIREGVARALASLASRRPLRVPESLRLELEFEHRSQAEMWAYLPWVSRKGPYTIELHPADPTEAMRVIAFAAFYTPNGLPTYGV